MISNINFKKWFSVFIIQVSLLFSSNASALKFGIFPQYQPVHLAELNAPLVNYLNQALSEPVYFRTTDNFATFKKLAEQQYYDILMVAPNIGYQLSLDLLYKPVMHVNYRPQAVFVVPKESRIKSFSDLKNKTISFPPNLAITTKLAYQKLTGIGLNKTGYKSVNRKSHLESFRWLALEKSDAAALTLSVWEALPKAEKKEFRSLGLSNSSPGIFILVEDLKWVEPLKKALISFEQSPQGQAYFEATKLMGYNPITVQDLSEIKALYQ
ncbi:MAG: PhnD/SsuA/transferrin family substrate-binding protein [Thiomicrorhabdus sp.]|jgi:ABC-type phosphate/phosphonate transport system substrate-binding protein|nr:PhnD/SsuA/transferrin family substrate-binding protein [Thiomicrorhabdus sp.]